MSGVVRDAEEAASRGSMSRTDSPTEDDDDDDTGDDSPAAGPSSASGPKLSRKLSVFTQSTSSVQTVTAARTSPSLARAPRLSDDPFGQLDPPTPPTTKSSLPPTPFFQSTPSVGLRSGLVRANSLSYNAQQDAVLQRYDVSSQSQLLRSHYCRGEVQFLLTLENISNRLLVVPKLARVSALRAELTSLNNKLPAEVSFPCAVGTFT